MSSEIIQLEKSIPLDKIKNRELYRVWFFTNERLVNFLTNTLAGRNFKRVFGVAGGGDFIFNLMSLCRVSVAEVCDVRPMATITVDFKKSLFKNFDFSEVRDLIFNNTGNGGDKVLSQIRRDLAPESREVFNFFSSLDKGGVRGGSFLNWLKKINLWYRESWRVLKHTEKYLYYLSSQDNYEQMRNGLVGLDVYYGDFTDTLSQTNDSFDLIYASNILDSKKYLRADNHRIELIRNKLSSKGLLLVTTQHRPRKIQKMLESQGLTLERLEVHRTRPWSIFKDHYDYSFLLFRKG